LLVALAPPKSARKSSAQISCGRSACGAEALKRRRVDAAHARVLAPAAGVGVREQRVLDDVAQLVDELRVLVLARERPHAGRKQDQAWTRRGFEAQATRVGKDEHLGGDLVEREAHLGESLVHLRALEGVEAAVARVRDRGGRWSR
jgi:hypothetical protein